MQRVDADISVTYIDPSGRHTGPSGAPIPVAKSLDAIVVNDVSREGVGFDSERNAVTIISRENVVEIPETTKLEVAQRVLDQIVQLRQRRKSAVKA